MAKNIHPQTQEVTFQFSQGRTMKIPSTHKKSTFLTETDIFIHQAWREDQKAVHTGSANVNKFNQAFGGASFASSISSVNLKNDKKEG
jgi:ribosomal protein L31